jgi:hypothetical protein
MRSYSIHQVKPMDEVREVLPSERLYKVE